MNIDQEGQMAPHSQEMEEAVLGAMLLESECVSDVMEILNKECFYKTTNAAIFGAIYNLFHAKQQIDILTVSQELKRLNQVELAGGLYCVTQLTNRVAASANVMAHARIVLSEFMRRKVIEVATSSIKDSYNNYKDPLDILDDFLSEGKKLYDHVSFGKINSTDELFIELMDDIDHPERKGLSTGLKEVDDIIVCLTKGLKYTIGGRPAMGKSSFANTLAHNLINQNSPGMIFTMEVSAKEMILNLTSIVCEIDNERLRKKTINEQEKHLIWKKMGVFKKELLIIDDKASVTPSYIYKKVKQAVKKKGIEWFIVDYTQLGSIDNPKGKMKEERVGEFSQEIKKIAKSENVIGIEIAQVKRLGEGDSAKYTRPSLHDLKDSGTIEASADVVFLLYRPEYYGFTTFGPKDNPQSSKGVAEIIVAKNKQGRTGSAFAEFIPQHTKFINRPEVEMPQGINYSNEIDSF